MNSKENNQPLLTLALRFEITHGNYSIVNPQQRKIQSEKILEGLGIPVPIELPVFDGEDAVALRTAEEVAERIIVLSHLNCVAIEGGIKLDVIEFLTTEALWDKASSIERQLFLKEELHEEELLSILWRTESIWLLLWVIKKIEHLPLPLSPADPRDVFQFIPKFLESPESFIRSAEIRDVSEILDQSDFIFRLAWALRHWEKDRTNEMTLEPGVAFERHFALNWVLKNNSDWDEMYTTD